MKNLLTNAPKWCSFPQLNMKTATTQSLKHAPVNSDMIIGVWQRDSRLFGGAGGEF